MNLTSKEFVKIYDEEKARSALESGNGNCFTENGELYCMRMMQPKIDYLSYKYATFERKDNGEHIRHTFIVYTEDGVMYMESRANGLAKKIILTRWLSANKVVGKIHTMKTTSSKEKTKDGERMCVKHCCEAWKKKD